MLPHPKADIDIMLQKQQLLHLQYQIGVPFKIVYK